VTIGVSLFGGGAGVSGYGSRACFATDGHVVYNLFGYYIIVYRLYTNGVRLLITRDFTVYKPFTK